MHASSSATFPAPSAVPRLTRQPLHSRARASVARAWKDPFALVVRLVIAFWVLVVIVPVVQIFSTSLSAASSMSSLSAFLLPGQFAPENYPAAAALLERDVIPIWKLYLNTAIYAVDGVVGSLIVGTLASYAFATMEFRGKRVLFTILLLGLVSPTAAFIVPEFLVVRTLGLSNTYQGVILPYIAFNTGICIMVLTTFFKELPGELYDAAKIDGASLFQVLVRVVLPLSRPAISTCTIFTFLGMWNEFVLAYVLINQKQMISLQIGVLGMFGFMYTPWHLVAAVLVLATLPVTLVFLVFQREFIEGLSAGALKG